MYQLLDFFVLTFFDKFARISVRIFIRIFDRNLGRTFFPN